MEDGGPAYLLIKCPSVSHGGSLNSQNYDRNAKDIQDKLCKCGTSVIAQFTLW